jgi:hypothetical protein
MATGKVLIQVCGWLVGIPLEVLLIAALLRGEYRRYPLVFLYAVAVFVTTLVEIPFYAQSWISGDAATLHQFAKIYWVNDWILQVLIFATVLSLIDRAISTSRLRRVMRAGLTSGAILLAGVSFSVHYRPSPTKIGYWMTPWTRDLGVCATILDLALWMILIASRKSDRRLLLISGALGMQFTGEAIGEAIRDLSMPKMAKAISLTGSIVGMVADLACLYLWWQTFRNPRDLPPSNKA